MRIVSESSEKKQHALIVDRKSTLLSHLLKEELKKFNNEVYIASQTPLAFEKFNYIFFINDKSALNRLEFNPQQKVVFIFINQKQVAQALFKKAERQRTDVKIISCQYQDLTKQELERVLWFSFSKSNEKFLNIEGLKRTDKKSEQKSKSFDWSQFITRRRVITALISLFIIAHLLTFPFLAASSYLYYQSAAELKKNRLEQGESLLASADLFFAISKTLYQPVRPTYSFFSLALYPDSLFDINEKTKSLLHSATTIYENSSQIFQLILKKNKTPQDNKLLDVRLERMGKDLSSVEDALLILVQKLPDKPEQLNSLKLRLVQISGLVEKARKIFPHLENLLAKNGEKKYLLLFANNMELRPGGGFIGSFGILTMRNRTLDYIQIYDVYDADGQLSVHVDPPDPIRKYLQQPHWFLRDSAFSSDFNENYNEAKFFLKQELGLTDFSGGILLTTTSIQNILEAYGNIYLSDFNETVNKDNFYIKAQLYSERDFFPGSIQKKNFLGDLAKQILIEADSVSAPLLVRQIEKSLDEKQMVMIVENQDVQKVLDSLYWAGKTITPRCTEEGPNCVIDFVFPVDANLGVNKANFFIRRDITQKIKVAEDGTISNSFVVNIQNDSANDVFPGGTYKNYFQTLLPLDSIVTQVTRDGVLVEDVDQRETEFKIIGLYFELPPQKSTEIQFDYRLSQKLPKGSTTYQLIWQKQTGSQNSDLNLEISLPENVSLIRQNFVPLVKDNRIFYNTSLDADKIFLIDLFNK